MKAKIHTRKVKQRQCYHIVGGSGKLFRTINAAAKSEAWRLIVVRYGPALQDVKLLHGRDCGCSWGTENDESYPIWVTDECSIHGKKYGYFARLHRRLWPLIVAKWQAEEQEIRRQ